MPLLPDVGPIFVGATHRPFVFSWTDENGAVIGDLTTVTLTARFRNRTSGASFTGTGVFAITDGPNAKFKYTASNADLANAGVFEVQITATWADSTKEASDMFLLPIEAII